MGLLAGLLDGGLLSGGDGLIAPERAVADRLSAPGRDLGYRLTPRGETVFGQIGVDLDAALAASSGPSRTPSTPNEQHHDPPPRGHRLCPRCMRVRRTDRRRVVRSHPRRPWEHLPGALGLAPGRD